ncbi:pTP [red squirrel adenovirus 1]|uniref:Preterminal protein n=1 Tax=red squirrel adenovirus 1 TaxID=2773314 RepID=A0A220A462_9ADEN|nr:pTP [red squirrel adenovirus 1]ARE31881.1 pTP [red squirrel adenovirus 1]WUG45422.1 pTP [Squirrel mastadenovirus A]
MALNAIDCARLTGQSVYTMELFRPLRNLWNRAQDWTPASVSAAGITWMSRFIYRYPRLMLMNLSPREPATLRWPLYSFPPPHFLVGYQYVVRVCNDYIFDTRAYSRIRYSQILAPHQQLVNWSLLANCTYTINTGAYHRFLDMDNFDETLNQIQQAILTDRVVADLAMLQPMRGFGSTQVDGEQNVPVAQMLQQQYRDISRCQDQAWGMADRVRIQNAGRKDLIILQTIRKLKNAYFHYLLSDKKNDEILSLPCDSDWLEAFVERFSDQNPGLSASINRSPLQKTIKSIISALSLPGVHPGNANELTGGAFELRPRENGRAVTEQMRRNRGEMIERFIDRLPIRRRRRRAPEIQEEEEEAPEEIIEEEEEIVFESEVRRAISRAIELLEHELTATARSQQFFNFAVDFYSAIQRLEALGDVNEMTLRRWVMYFFVAEHVATTLNYLHHHLRNTAPFNRIVELNISQLVMRARDDTGRIVYSRVWNEQGSHSLQTLMRRVSTDLSATVERAGHAGLDEEEIEQFMTDIAYHDNSGDVQEILKQLEMNDVDIDSIELSFRFRLTGPVVFSQHREIQKINRRVVNLATRFRQERRELPPLNADIRLPPQQ